MISKKCSRCDKAATIQVYVPGFTSFCDEHRPDKRPNNATPEELAKYACRAHAYDDAALALEDVRTFGDIHTRGTLDTMAYDLRDMARKWRECTEGGL